jgi:large subunit ribosomal protein L22
MGKKPTPRPYGDNEAAARLRTIRISPQKLNLIAGLIRGKHITQAIEALAFSQKRAARDVFNLLMSAVSNAEHNHGLDVDNLYVAEAYVGKAMVLRRFHARARGRGAKILKPFSQMNIVLREMRN